MKGRNAEEENTKGGNQNVQLVQKEIVKCAIGILKFEW